MMVHSCNPSYSEAEVGGLQSEAGPEKQTKKKKIKQKDWEHGLSGRELLSKFKALNSIPRTPFPKEHYHSFLTRMLK
jgi:hypothetical protein